MRTDLPLDALNMALWQRDVQPGELTHHSDRGAQYLSIRYTERLVESGAAVSVGSKGDSYDKDALAETVNGLFKAELVQRHGPWRSLDELELATLEYIDWFNHRRLHSACRYRPPAEYEPSTTLSTTPRSSRPGRNDPSLQDLRRGSIRTALSSVR
jgi:putative transposase